MVRDPVTRLHVEQLFIAFIGVAWVVMMEYAIVVINQSINQSIDRSSIHPFIHSFILYLFVMFL